MWDIQKQNINNCPTYCNWNSSRAQSLILEVVVVVVMIMVMVMNMMKFIVFQLLLGTQVTEYKSR